MSSGKTEAASVLLAIYLEKRPALVRYFALRLGSQAAAEDLVQDIYLRIERVDPGEVASPAAYLYRLGSNLMLDRLKQQRRSAARDDAWQDSRHLALGDQQIADEPAADEALASRQRMAKMMEAMQELPPQCRRAFELHKFDGLSHGETAAAMGISRSAVEKHISLALRRLLARIG